MAYTLSTALPSGKAYKVSENVNGCHAIHIQPGFQQELALNSNILSHIPLPVSCTMNTMQRSSLNMGGNQGLHTAAADLDGAHDTILDARSLNELQGNLS